MAVDNNSKWLACCYHVLRASLTHGEHLRLVSPPHVPWHDKSGDVVVGTLYLVMRKHKHNKGFISVNV